MTNRNVRQQTNDDLEEIEGIGPGYATALHRAGIDTFAQLAQCASPEDLHAVLLEKAEADVPLWKIERSDWIGQARKKVAAQVVTKKAAVKPQPATAEAGAGSEEARPPEQWQEHAVFMVFFERQVGEEGVEMWQTRTYRSENDGDVATFPGVNPPQWLEWIIDNAHLPFDVSLSPPGAQPAETAETEKGEVQIPANGDFTLAITGVQVSELGPTAEVPEKRLGADIQFDVAWSEGGPGPPAGSHYRAEIHAVDLESGETTLVASERGRLDPDLHSYHSRQHFPIPEVGRYRLHYVVVLLPPASAAAFHQGPTINVRP